jgi:hypothetical protein
LHQLALIRQSRHFGCHCIVRVIIIVLAKDAEHILLVWIGKGISVMACSGFCCIEVTLKSLLDEGLQGNPRLGGGQ